jgi:hypothetical protein
MSSEAIIGMVICLSITVGGFLFFLLKAIRSDKPDKSNSSVEK